MNRGRNFLVRADELFAEPPIESNPIPNKQSVPEALNSLDFLPMEADSTSRRERFRDVVGFAFWLVQVGNGISAVTF